MPVRPSSRIPRRATPGGPRGRVVAVLLAAGESKRMGSPKPLVRFGGRSLLELALATLLASTVDQIVVVLGHEAARIRAEVAMDRVQVVESPAYAEGLSSSIRTGFHAADPGAGAYLFALADQPFVSPETVNAILRHWEKADASLVVPTFRGRRGNPVLVDHRLVREIESISGDVGFRALFRTRASEIRYVPVDDPGILFDVDTPSNLEPITKAVERGRLLRDVLIEVVGKDARGSR